MTRMLNRAVGASVGASVVATTLLFGAVGAIAQEQEVIIYVEDVDGVTLPRPQVDASIFPYVAEPLSDRLIDTFYTNDQNYYENRSIGRQIDWFFGFSHTENEINRDGQAFSEYVRDMWDEQMSSSPTVRTLDLPNPYQSSLLLEPTIPEQEFPATTFRQPIAPPPAIAAPSEPGPVRALW